MKKLLGLFLFALPFLGQAADYQSTMIVQTGQLRESDLIVRTVTDLETNKICLTFYISTAGTSPAMSCYETRQGFRSKVRQVGHFKEGKLVVRKLKDIVNDVSCLVVYTSTQGTSPAISCFQDVVVVQTAKGKQPVKFPGKATPAKAQAKAIPKDEIMRDAHLREGDLELYRVLEPDSAKSCLIAYVNTEGTKPQLVCYSSLGDGKGSMRQTGYMREGDLVVRKIADQSNKKECLVTYVSTEGTSPNIYCYDN
ncbi:MAG: hypothetical protein EP297_00445 [Gammaproteobacteria bacterium]|nr:MAG: hypothetical protein EP297_00445 [Gammaproteobacteria bacterium]